MRLRNQVRSGETSSWSWGSDLQTDQRWHPAVTLQRAKRKHLRAAGVVSFIEAPEIVTPALNIRIYAFNIYSYCTVAAGALRRLQRLNSESIIDYIYIQWFKNKCWVKLMNAGTFRSEKLCEWITLLCCDDNNIARLVRKWKNCLFSTVSFSQCDKVLWCPYNRCAACTAWGSQSNGELNVCTFWFLTYHLQE